MEINGNNHDKITQAEKNANDFAWYKEKIRLLDSKAGYNTTYNGFDDVRRMKINYDLFNNILNLDDFKYVAKPFGDVDGELPATLTNRDISSTKIKVLHGLEMRRPFGYKVVAVNEEATTRREEAEFNLLQEFVVNEILLPIKQELEIKFQQQVKGKNLTNEQIQQLQQQVAEELKAKTPDQVKKYMARKHQDPAEALMHQILEYLIKDQNVVSKFLTGWKHSTLSAKEIYFVGILNDEPVLRIINPLRFRHEETMEAEFIEDGSWARAEYRMTPDEIVGMFSDKIKDSQIKELFDNYNHGSTPTYDNYDFTFSELNETNTHTIDVVHYEFKSLRKIGFVTYLDSETGKEAEDIVSENYKLNKSAGDIKIEWKWIPELHETWRVGKDIYFDMRPVQGQHKDLDKLHVCKLRYKGVCYDNMNSQPTSIMDRIKGYQYYYNIILYRIELLMASDKGKKILLNIKAIDKSISMEQWLYYLDAINVGLIDPTQDGLRGQNGDITQMAKEVDMSLVSDIEKYMRIAEYIENRCGASIGVTKQMEGEINTNDAVTNTKQSIIQGTTILEPYFDLHNQVKQNVLSALVEQGKIAYSTGKKKLLTYVLDDMSIHMLTIDQKLLDASTYGLFVLNSPKSAETKQLVEQLSHAALQNQTVDLSAVIKVIRSEGIQEAEELLEVAEQQKRDDLQTAETMKINAQAKENENMREFQRETWKEERDQIVLKEKERRKTVLQQATISALGFSEDKDLDDDGTPDVMEVYQHGLNAMIAQNKMAIENADLDIKKQLAEHKMKTDEEKLSIDRMKAKKVGTKK